MLAAIQASFALKLAAAAAATAAVAGVAQATDTVDLTTLFQGSGSTAVESNVGADADANIGVDGGIGAEDRGAAVDGGIDLGVGLG